MLENMRRQGASIFVYLIFCLLIAIFIINFRPGQGGRSDQGCTGANNLIVSVNGNDVSQTAYHIAYSNGYNRASGKNGRAYAAFEQLIRREILAEEAEKRGMLVTTSLVEDEIKKGYFFYGGDRLTIPGIFDEDGLWNLNAYKAWIGELNVSKNSYEVEQSRSMEATLMADLLREGVQVSRDEALQAYLYDNTLVKYDVVEFNPDDYKAAMHLTDADVDRYLAEHAEDVSKRYKADERLYKGVGRQLKLREIFIAKEEPKKEEPKKEEPKKDEPKKDEPKKDGKAAGSAAGSAAPAGSGSAAPAPVEIGPSINELKAKLDTMRATIASGKLKFEEAARQLSTEPELKASGGDIGWHKADSAALGEKAISDAVKSLKKGEMTPVVTTDRGVYLVMAEDERSGDLSFDQVKKEIATSLAKDEWSKEAAKRAALKALDEARAAKDKTLDTLYPHETTEPYMPPVQIKKQVKSILQMLRSGQQLPDEFRQQLFEQLQQMEMYLQQQRAQILAMSDVGGKDQPASWQAEPGSGTAAGAAAGSGSAAAAGSGSAAAAGSAAGSGTGMGTGTGTGAAPKVDDLTPTKDELPKIEHAPEAKVSREGPAPRMHVMPGIGKSKEVADALFDELGVGQLAKKVYVVHEDNALRYVVLQLVEKTQPKVEDFDKEAAADIEELREARAAEAVNGWLKDRCETLAKANKIKVNAELIRETDDKGNVLPTVYRPCQSFR